MLLPIEGKQVPRERGTHDVQSEPARKAARATAKQRSNAG
jgi:hypothetical protein